MVQAVNSHFVTSDNNECWKMHMRFEFILTEYIIISPATNSLKTKCLLSISVQLKAVFICFTLKYITMKHICTFNKIENAMVYSYFHICL